MEKHYVYRVEALPETNIINKGDRFSSGWSDADGLVDIQFEAVTFYALNIMKDKLQLRLVRYRKWLDSEDCGSGDDMCRCEKCEIITTYDPHKKNQPHSVGRIFMAKAVEPYEEDGDVWLNLEVHCFTKGNTIIAQRLVKETPAPETP